MCLVDANYMKNVIMIFWLITQIFHALIHAQIMENVEMNNVYVLKDTLVNKTYINIFKYCNR